MSDIEEGRNSLRSPRKQMRSAAMHALATSLSKLFKKLSMYKLLALLTLIWILTLN